MTLRLIALLASLLALPGLVSAQAVQGGQAAKPAPIARPATPTARSTASAPSGPALIDVNSADEKALDALPGVGPARAKAIVANRPYSEKAELVSKKAIPSNVLPQIEDKIALVNVNTATAAMMAKILPNVGPVRAQQIVEKRPFATLQDLVAKGALTQGVFEGLRGLVTTGS